MPRLRGGLGFTAVVVLLAGTLLVLSGCKKQSAANDFAAVVKSTNPIAYYRLTATSGASLIGASTYQGVRGVSVADSAPPTGMENKSLGFNGKDGWITTTLKGGVDNVGSIMAWVNFAKLPSATGRFFYVAGESEVGNDFDLQFEQDDFLRFYTAAGGHVEYKPDPKTLLNQWHMIVATMDIDAKTSTLYWDGKPVQTAPGAGRPHKTTPFSIGASTYFAGRWFAGNIADVALWSRALTASEVAAIYGAAK